MRKVIIILVLSFIGIAAKAQVSSNVTLTLNREQIKTILTALQDKPYKEVAEVINLIVNQTYATPPKKDTTVATPPKVDSLKPKSVINNKK